MVNLNRDEFAAEAKRKEEIDVLLRLVYYAWVSKLGRTLTELVLAVVSDQPSSYDKYHKLASLTDEQWAKRLTALYDEEHSMSEVQHTSREK